MIYEIKKNVISVGANDPDRKLFDTLVPLSQGTTYNSYLVRGSSKTALIDTVDPTKSDLLIQNIKDSGVEKIDYIVINHAEQDHSGSLPLLLEKFVEAKIICSDKCMPMLVDLLNVSADRFQVVKDGDLLDLGGKTLQFVYLPWVHWPETMVTYLQEDKLLFSCDFFGAHLGAENLLVSNEDELDKYAKMYFAEIMMPFRVIIRSNIAKLENLDIDMITPSHGPIHKDVKKIINSYKEWISDDVKKIVVIAYISMHGSTKIMAEYLADNLIKKDIEVHLYDISSMEIGEIASDLVQASTFIIGTPCFLGGIHPGAANLLYLANMLRPKTKFVSVLGSFGWSGGIAEVIMPMIKNLKAEIIPPVIVRGLPREKDFLAMDDLVGVICDKNVNLI